MCDKEMPKKLGTDHKYAEKLTNKRKNGSLDNVYLHTVYKVLGIPIRGINLYIIERCLDLSNTFYAHIN